MRIWISLLVVFYSISAFAQVETIVEAGHAHNDYRHDKPLLDALSCGFRSIEIDVYLYNDRLVVTHDPFGLNKKPGIEELYLDPLVELMADEKRKAHYMLKGSPLVLMIDFKSKAEPTYKKLVEVLSSYKNILSRYKNGQKIKGLIDVVISGNRPIETVAREEVSYVTIDGRLGDLEQPYNGWHITRISSSYRSAFKWNGKGKMPDNELEKLREIISKAHANGQKVRFWSAPETPELFKLFLDEGVDWISVDDLKGFHKFYVNYSVKH